MTTMFFFLLFLSSSPAVFIIIFYYLIVIYCSQSYYIEGHICSSLSILVAHFDTSVTNLCDKSGVQRTPYKVIKYNKVYKYSSRIHALWCPAETVHFFISSLVTS